MPGFSRPAAEVTGRATSSERIARPGRESRAKNWRLFRWEPRHERERFALQARLADQPAAGHRHAHPSVFQNVSTVKTALPLARIAAHLQVVIDARQAGVPWRFFRPTLSAGKALARSWSAWSPSRSPPTPQSAPVPPLGLRVRQTKGQQGASPEQRELSPGCP